ncbi:MULTISPECIES: DUF4184 family protein [Microbacterium]|uniref:DUF4184 family protein n=1 Tax=Microbacterium TaxID=33882 RepID=UPI00217E7848|nr:MULTISPECIES: DUF4184 family protein [Microbacterium]UWF76842.1 DUF4184 family protein [Microbacterium neungamense]WCM54997.1 DUF4184 family protein [Microbacterium sp. EF45047]
MPLTPSHAVVALPFLRTPLVPGAIAVGAMTPDLPLFLRVLDYGFTHAFGNAIWTAALAFLLFLVWRVLLRPVVPELMPAAVARRLPAEWSEPAADAARHAVGVGRGVRYPVLLAGSLLLGVFSHIAWDLFTHEGRWGVTAIPALQEQWGPLLGYKWLQHGSSAAGLAVLAVFAVLWLSRRDASTPITRVLPAWARLGWWLALPAVLVVAWVAGLVALGPFTAEFTPQHLAYRVLPPACAVWGAATLALCIVLAARRRR